MLLIIPKYIFFVRFVERKYAAQSNISNSKLTRKSDLKRPYRCPGQVSWLTLFRLFRIMKRDFRLWIVELRWSLYNISTVRPSCYISCTHLLHWYMMAYLQRRPVRLYIIRETEPGRRFSTIFVAPLTTFQTVQVIAESLQNSSSGCGGMKSEFFVGNVTKREAPVTTCGISRATSCCLANYRQHFKISSVQGVEHYVEPTNSRLSKFRSRIFFRK